MAGKVITVAQQKGGAGKTTLAVHLAVALADKGHSVAAVDIDPQQSLTSWYRLRQSHLSADRLGLSVEQVKGYRARASVETLARNHDLVIVDSPPHMETEARIAVRAADLVVIPVQPSPMDVWATAPTIELAASEQVPALLVFNRVPPRANLTDAMRSEVKRLGAKVARSQIGNRVAFAGALAEGRAVVESGRRGRAAQEMDSLAKEILRILR